MIDRSGRQQRTLGEFLRAHRARLSPAGLGLPAGQRRRTPGLRREEVAQRCGLSVTWYTWLEQGRDVAASPQTLASLARALQLTPAERAYLFQIAGRLDPDASSTDEAADVPPALAEALASISGPAYVLDRLWNARACNDAARRLFVGWLDGEEPNLLRYVFLNPVARRVIPDWTRAGPPRAGGVPRRVRAAISTIPPWSRWSTTCGPAATSSPDAGTSTRWSSRWAASAPSSIRAKAG